MRKSRFTDEQIIGIAKHGGPRRYGHRNLRHTRQPMQGNLNYSKCARTSVGSIFAKTKPDSTAIDAIGLPAN